MFDPAKQARAVNCTMAMEHFMGEDLPALFAEDMSAASLTTDGHGLIAVNADGWAAILAWAVENPGHARELVRRLALS